MYIGDNIKKYRRLANITQVELAKKLKRSESTIRKYESNEVVPSIKFTCEIATALGVHINDLICESEVEGKHLSDYSTEELLLELLRREKLHE